MKNGLSPPAHPIWGHLLAFKRDPLGFLTHCACSYGSVVPLRLLYIPAALLLDPVDIERVLVSEHREFVKPAWLRTAAVRRLLGDGLVTSDGEAWRQQRHVCQPAFHPRRMDHYGEMISVLAERMLERWKPGETRDLLKEMAHLTMEIIACTLLGVDLPGWTPDASDAMDTLMARFSAGMSLYGMMPLPPGLHELRAARQLDGIVDQLIRIRMEADNPGSAVSTLCPHLRVDEAPEKTGEDLLTQVTMSARANGAGISRKGVREQVKTFLGAGYESSSLTLCWAFVLLAQHPAVETALADELASVLQGRAPVPADLPCLPYARAVIQETLRLYPPLWMTGRQSVHPCEIGGVRISAGALVMTSQWAVQRLPRYFPCPNEFRPERWMNGETAELPRFACFPFGGGPRICIGQSFAMMETVLMLAAIARQFRLRLVPGPEIRPWATMTLRPLPRVQVQLAERS